MSDDRKQLPAVITAEEHSRVTKAILDFVSDGGRGEGEREQGRAREHAEEHK